MEHVNSVWNSGEPAFAVNSPGKGTPIGKNNIHCTFFRQPKPPCAKNHSPELSNQYPASPKFETCTDSDSELDELTNAKQWLQMPSCSNHCTAAEPISKLGKRVLGKPVVTFDGTSCSRAERPVKFCMRKRSIIRGTDNASKKAARLTKRRNYLGPKNDQKAKHPEKLNKTPNSSHKQHGNPIARNNKVFLTERTNNSELMRALSDIRNILHGTKMNPANVASSIEEEEAKKRKPVQSRIVRNKQLLMSMKNVIRAMKVQEVAEGPGLESLQSIEARNKVAETNLATVGADEDRGKSLSRDRTEKEEEMRMPIFMKPELEQLLNESMHRAVKKYRISGNTWEKLKREKILSRNSSEPKNPATCLLLENHFPS